MKDGFIRGSDGRMNVMLNSCIRKVDNTEISFEGHLDTPLHQEFKSQEGENRERKQCLEFSACTG